MKNCIALICIAFMLQLAVAQQPYYDDVDLSLTGQDLYDELQAKIDISNNTFTYGDVRDVVKITDEDPSNANNLLLIYGYDDNGSCTTDRSRDKDDFGGGTCEYNREHVFSRSNANPSMGSVNNNTTGIGADPHNLRPSDQQMNNNRGSKKFAAGTGNAGNVGSGNWYPGDEWKGDVARMMMYMYTRYGDRCLPSLNGSGALQGTTDMLQIYLQWNAEDPVSEFEDQRNPYLETEYGNRNPFIDNPALATIIWGGPQAEDRWDLLNTPTIASEALVVFPNPASETIWVQSTTAQQAARYVIYDLHGRIIKSDRLSLRKPIQVSNLSNGLYVLELEIAGTRILKKVSIDR
ncbi:endonuclease [Candidatus Ulvibacter alkanivorans]|uniref:endonuclease n=1 Tax=Candidatus Ulvibacter alkanivorans TaxID=2267620 RepID=UPI000DF38718|nr:endonuclease [Candidatus Ulvibacter alkanivorans]